MKQHARDPKAAMKNIDVIDDLMKAGFTEYEARVYLSLLTSHPASAYTISQNSGVPHSRVYDISRRLIAGGYAVSSGTNPETFSPLSPEELIDKIKRDNSRLTENLKKKLKQIDFTPDFDPVWNIKSPEEAIEKVREIVHGAEKKIYLGIWREDFILVKEDLRQADARGVKTFMLIYGQTEVDFGCSFFHERAHLEKSNILGRNIDCTADSRVCITGDLGGPGPTKVVWTRNYGLVFSIENYLIHDLFLHEVHNHFSVEMDRVFGKNMQKLRDRFLHLKD
jgi:sugar-specific transcriptional regulator TrmB